MPAAYAVRPSARQRRRSDPGGPGGRPAVAEPVLTVPPGA